jgi:hypothetical protein
MRGQWSAGLQFGKNQIGISTVIAGALLMGACAVAPETNATVSRQSVTTITNCTGDAISQAVAAGGEVDLDCGPTPVTIAVPSTNVTLNAVLRAVTPGTITLTHTGTLFSVQAIVQFEADNLAFTGTGAAVIGAPGANVTLTNDTFSNYSSTIVAVGNRGSILHVFGSTFANNHGTGFNAGPAVQSAAGDTTFDRCTFINNSFPGGGAFRYTGFLAFVTNSTFANNSSGTNGGAIQILGGADVQITNSTFFNNKAAGLGSAIFGESSNLSVQSSTFFTDTATPSGMISFTREFPGNREQLFDSIIVDPGAPSQPCKLAGTSNLQWPAGSSLCGAGFALGDPNLATLADNGGPTQTMAIQLPSAAFRAATAPCPATDQRGVARGTACDIGAYQVPAN